MQLQPRQQRLLAIGLSVVIVFGSQHVIKLIRPGPSVPQQGAMKTIPAPPAPAEEAGPVGAAQAAALATSMPPTGPTPAASSAASRDLDGLPVLPSAPDRARLPGDLSPRIDGAAGGATMGWRSRPPIEAPVLPATEETYGPYGLPCGPELSASTLANGDLRLAISAPCRLHSRLNVALGPLNFTARTDHIGAWSASLPPLAEGTLAITFEDGAVLRQRVSGGQNDIAALIAPPEAAMHLHVYEAGAGDGGPGHLHAGIRSAEGQGRFYRLGAPDLTGGQIAELYAAPRGKPPARLSVEVEVTEANCGHDVAGTALLPGEDGTLEPRQISFAVPDCDALGEFLVLKNLAPDRTLAAR